MVTKLFRTEYLIFLIAVLLLGSCDSKTPALLNNSRAQSKFIGYKIAEVRKELGAPTSSSKTTDGKEIFYFVKNKTLISSAPDVQVLGWQITVEDGIVIFENPIYGYYSSGSASSGSSPGFIAMFATVSNTEEEGSIKVDLPSDHMRRYFLNNSSAICITHPDKIELRAGSVKQSDFIIYVHFEGPEKELFRKFTSESLGKTVLLTLNNEPIVVSRVLAEIDSGEFIVETSRSPEIMAVFKKLGL